MNKVQIWFLSIMARFYDKFFKILINANVFIKVSRI